MGRIRDVIETLFRIYDKSGKLVNFTLNDTQRVIDDVLDRGVGYLDILKSRQKGCSSYIMARFLVECMTEHQIVTMLAHDKDHTEKLLRRSQEFLSNIKGPKPSIERMNANEIYFKKTQSSFYIGTAGSKNFGRSATITRLHMSEFAFWENPKVLLTGLLQAVPFDTGVIIIETTANGWGSYHQQHYYRAMANPLGRITPLFIPWNIDREYQSKTPLLPPLNEDEVELQSRFNLTLPQLQWRREKLEEFDNDLPSFKQEYPLCIEDAFMFSGTSLFNDLTLSETKEWKPLNKEEMILEGHPRKGMTYVLGADSSGGTGHDFSAIVGVCVETKEQVYEYASNTISPPQFGKKLAEVGKRFGNALLVPESNSHGLSVISILKDIYPLRRMYRYHLFKSIPQQGLTVPSYGYGWKTTSVSKPYLVGNAKKFIELGWQVHSPRLYDQMKAFSEDPQTGKLGGIGEHDDHAISFMLACVGVLKTRRLNPYGTEEEEKREEESRREEGKVIDISKWRDTEGRYLLKFEDNFKRSKIKRNVHLKNNEAGDGVEGKILGTGPNY